MEDILVKCPAKINLSLDVIGKREDGYHFLRMIMQTITLFDEVKLEKRKSGVKVNCNNRIIPQNASNTAYKAAELMFEKYNIEGGIEIYINKNIPIAAGLAGGSADAAGVIKGIDRLYGLNLKIDEMMDLGLKVGADVPYCIMGGTALAEGIGEKLTPLRAFDDVWCVIAKPDISVSTKEVYGTLKIDEISRHPNTEQLIYYIKEKDVESLSQNMVNVLETVTIKDHPIIFEIKNIMMDYHALGSMMSGSGPTVFGLFRDRTSAEACYNRLRDYLKEVYLVKTFSEGV